MSRRRLAILAIACLVALPLAAPTNSAWAHGEAEWIRDGQYEDAGGTHCCGPSDCKPVPAETIREFGGHVYVIPTGEIFDSDAPQIHWSVDGQWWLCARGGAHPLPVPAAGGDVAA